MLFILFWPLPDIDVYIYIHDNVSIFIEITYYKAHTFRLIFEPTSVDSNK